MLTGINHLTLAVRDLDRSIDFYRQTLGLTLHARWSRGAYFSAGDLWLCLSLDRQTGAIRPAHYTHYAFSIEASQFAPFVEKLRAAGVQQWNRDSSEGASFYFLDPDGHQLEAHVGDLASRLAACRAAPYDGMEFFD